MLRKLAESFSQEELLDVPGFYRADAGQVRFSLFGEYVLIPYHDCEGYVTTVEGRLVGEPENERQKKYKALLGSGSHLYVHPRFSPDEVVAFCEGAIGAMVAARSGIAVAFKGFRNYRRPVGESREDYEVLPELAGVDFSGRAITYVPDVDVKEAEREKVMEAAPRACEWLIERQGGVAKIALLPRKSEAEDLDAWLLTIPEEERPKKFEELVASAISPREWETGARQNGVQPAASSGELAHTPQDEGEETQPPCGYLKGDPSEGPEKTFCGSTRSGQDTDSATDSDKGDTTELSAPPVTGEGPEPSDSNSQPRQGFTDTDAQSAHARMSPQMRWWYDVGAWREEENAEASEVTRLMAEVAHGKPGDTTRTVRLPRWDSGEVMVALAITLFGGLLLWALAAFWVLPALVPDLAALAPRWPVGGLCFTLAWWAANFSGTIRYGRKQRELARHLAPKRQD